jgi:hypothetical protein
MHYPQFHPSMDVAPTPMMSGYGRR